MSASFFFKRHSLCDLDLFVQVFIKSELKVGIIYVKEGQYTEEEILDNNEHSPLFNEFLQIVGDKVRLKGTVSAVSIINNLSSGFFFLLKLWSN